MGFVYAGSSKNKSKDDEKREDSFSSYHLAVHICLFNDRNEMLIQQRFKKRKTWSGLWDMSAGDSALMNETSYMAAEREVYEELGIQLSLKDIRLF